MSEKHTSQEDNSKKNSDSSNEIYPSSEPMQSVSTPAHMRQIDVADTGRTKISKIKLGFLYLLIGGLVITAFISVIALLAGTITQSIQSAFVTTALIVVYSALLLTIVLADTKNELGRKLLPTGIFVVLILNMITHVLSVWDIISGELASRFVAAFFTIIAGAFLVEGVLKLSLKQSVVRALSYATASVVGLLVAAVLPWVLASNKDIFGDLYYRIIAAISIIIVTSLIVTTIMNRINIYQRPELRSTTHGGTSGGMIAIIATVGTITALYMVVGIALFVAAAAKAV